MVRKAHTDSGTLFCRSHRQSLKTVRLFSGWLWDFLSPNWASVFGNFVVNFRHTAFKSRYNIRLRFQQVVLLTDVFPQVEQELLRFRIGVSPSISWFDFQILPVADSNALKRSV